MTIERVLQNDRGEGLALTLHEPDHPSGGGVVLCHGMLSSRQSPKHRGICEALARAGHLAVRFDFAGRGDSEGPSELITYERQVGDLLSVHRWVSRRADGVVLVGSSMGAAVAILAAMELEEIRGVLGIAAVGDPLAVMKGLLPRGEDWDRWRAEGVIDLAGQRVGASLIPSLEAADVYGAASGLGCPLRLVHGIDDEVVPIEQARRLCRLAPEASLVEIEGGDHLLHRPSDQVVLEGEAVAFVGSQLATGGQPRRRS